MTDVGIIMVMRNEKLHELIINVIELFGSKFSLSDLLLSKSLSSNTKEKMKRIFGGDYQTVSSQDFCFENRDGLWMNIKADYVHRYTMEILISLQETRYSVGSEIPSGDLGLTEMLINYLEDIFQKESDCPDLYAGIETDREEIDFISKNLSLKFGKTAKVDYHLIKAFVELYHDYDETILGRCVEEIEEV